MFSQLLPRMQRDCKQVICDTVPRLIPLLERTFPGVHFYGTLKQKELDWPVKYDIDAHIHLSYLPKFYLNSDKDFERKPYLKLNEELVAKFAEDIKDYPKPWVGIAWHGGIQSTQTHLRSVDLVEFAPIIEKAGTVFDLSYHNSTIEVARWNIANKKQIVKLQVDKEDFDITVALVALMDEIATVTTTVAHVCGALGRKARVLVNETPQWRYAYKFAGGKEMIWYPRDSVQLYRRMPGEKDWSQTIKRLAKDLP
jgi:hypothetical protein